jgi:magnesium-transporting ATPase (P-type)
MEKIEEKPKINYIEQRTAQRKFLQKTSNLMYVLVFLCVVLSVFFYIITVGSKPFIIGAMLFIALLGTITAIDAKKHLNDIDTFDLYYGLGKVNKLQNDDQKKV